MPAVASGPREARRIFSARHAVRTAPPAAQRPAQRVAQPADGWAQGWSKGGAMPASTRWTRSSPARWAAGPTPRYVDDRVLMHDDKRVLAGWGAAVRGFALQRLRLRLRLHAHSVQGQPVRAGVPWLGQVLYPGHRRLESRKVVAATRRLTPGLAATAGARACRAGMARHGSGRCGRAGTARCGGASPPGPHPGLRLRCGPPLWIGAVGQV